MRLNSVRSRIMLANFLTLAIVFLLLTLSIRYALQASLSTSVDSGLVSRAKVVQRNWSGLDDGFVRWFIHGEPGDGRRGPSFRRRGPREGMRLVLGPTDEGPDSPEYWNRPRLFSPSGKPLFHREDNPLFDSVAFRAAARGRALFSTPTLGHERVRVYSAPLLRQGQVEGVIQVAHPMAEMDSLLSHLRSILLAVIPLTILVAAGLGALLAEGMLRPVREITEAAERLRPEDLSYRLPVSGSDEFSRLAVTFNAMVSRVRAAFEELERAFAQQRRFVGDASHELRTPLTRLKTNTSLALSGDHTNEEYRQSLRADDDAADTMSRIVLDLLTLARSDEGQLEMERVPTPIAEVLARAAHLAGTPGGAPIIVERIDPDLTVMGDPHSLTRLFVNIIENAVRYTPSSGRVTVQAIQVGRAVKARIIDTGEGIAPEHLPHVFDRFYRVDTARTRARGGSGLGLSIARSIVDAHGGDLSIDSTPGVGTAVTVSLPLGEE